VFKLEVYRHSQEQPFRFQDLQIRQSQLLLQQMPTLLAAELPSTLSLGRRQSLEVAEAWKRRVGEGVDFDVVQADRGGLETWHGPGQWVIYFVLPLERLSGRERSAKRAVMNALEFLLTWIRRYRSDAKIETGDRLGIWGRDGKLVSIGLRIKQGWIQSGVAINVVSQPFSFFGISPCGLESDRPDFLMNSTQVNPNLTSNRASLLTFDKIPSEIADNLSAFHP
jgi:lipoate-protein ligase B